MTPPKTDKGTTKEYQHLEAKKLAVHCFKHTAALELHSDGTKKGGSALPKTHKIYLLQGWLTVSEVIASTTSALRCIRFTFNSWAGLG